MTTYARTALLLPIAALAVLLPLLVLPAPTADAYTGAPIARTDGVKVRAGKANTKAVLRNDDVQRKRKARVKIVRAPGKLRATVVNGKKIRVRPRNKVKGRFKVVYKVIDFKGRKDKAVLRVKVKPHAKSLIVRTRRLPKATEVRDGYDRNLFNHWTDADGDCFDTRAEVLLQETRATATWNEHCTVKTGKWFSYYDGVWTTDAGDFDTDHLVPLAESWDSGARNWTSARRERFANDLGDRRSLVAVTASSNRSKSDQDPAEWMPERKKCRYATEWVAVKTRWSLTVDHAEKKTLLSYAKSCSHRIVRVKKAS